MNQKYEKLKNLLKELFQLNEPDLDFGLYRIMHAKSAEITKFLDEDLLPQVQEAFSLYKTADKEEIEKELSRAITQARDLGADPDSTPKVKELREKLSHTAIDISALENEVYDHLYSFFRRYYSEGDFLSKRVYKPGVYAIPYEGEEVKLYWANYDQYYIKTSEYLRDYAFRLNPANATNPMRVHFRLVDAAEGEHGNIKEAQGKERRFKLADEHLAALEQGELVIRFTYEPQPEKQKDLNATAERTILALTDPSFAPWIELLKRPHRRADGTESENTRLRVHLDRYTARNTFDYFIHKDLRGFLRRELDFYIKNEVMHLDDIENESAPRVEQYLSKIKVIRTIAGKIIDFLAQLEDFQKKLWLKKKFVTETSWCIRVGIIPQNFYPEVAANTAQWEEWKALHGLEGEVFSATGGELFATHGRPGTTEFLKAHPTLMIDSRHFSPDFTGRLLEAIGNIDEQTDGVLVHSENWQALNLLSEKYRDRINQVHIDPPYNTDISGFIYKNDYRHSSWLAMMMDRLLFSRCILKSDGVFTCHIDENEFERLRLLFEQLFGYVGTAVWDKLNPMMGAKELAIQHEYIFFCASESQPFIIRPQNVRKILSIAREIIRKHGRVTDQAKQEFAAWVRSAKELTGGERAYQYLDDDGQVYRLVAMTWPNPNPPPPEFFQPLIHPVTKKHCPVPSRGWSQSPRSMQALIEKGEIIFGPDETTQPQKKVHLSENKALSSVIRNGSRGKTEIENLGLDFNYNHPVTLYTTLLDTGLGTEGIALDFFAGSGTTGHAVINLNREDGGRRKFILVEMADYFDTVLLPRLKKVTFTPEWKDGKPKRLATPEEAERSPRMFKIIRLESYEDTLNNLEVQRTKEQENTLFSSEAQGSGGLKEQYILNYMLDVETRGSQSLLNLDAFSNPLSYQLKVKRPGSDESQLVSVDLIETFNWLIGLTVAHVGAQQTFNASFERDSEGRLRLSERLRLESSGTWWLRTVEGTAPDGRKTLVIWRNLTGDFEKDNLVLDEWFTRKGYSSKDSEFDLIYVNGTNNLENLRLPDATWKVRLIEEDFHRLMFEMEENL